MPEHQERYVTLALAGTGRDVGVSIVEVHLNLGDLLRELKIGERGVGYDLDDQGRVIENYDTSLFQRDFSSLPQVEAARRIWVPPPAQAMSGKDINGHDVLVAYDTIPPLGWWFSRKSQSRMPMRLRDELSQ
jgi:hypothetical protein